MRNEFESAFKRGESAQIPGEYLAVEFPESFENLTTTLFGVSPGEVSMLHVKSRPSDKRTPVRISIECDDGDSGTLDYIEWQVVQSGEERLVLANDNQAFPIRVVHEIDLKETTTNTTVSLKEGPVAAPLLLQLLHFVGCMAKPCAISIWMIDPGLPLGSSRSEGLDQETADPRFIEVMVDLAEIQRKVGKPIYVPLGEFSKEDLEAIALLRGLLRRNESVGTWTDLTFGQERDVAAETIDALTKDSKGVAFRADVEEEVELFGVRIPLGQVRHVFKNARLAEDADLRRRVEQGDEVIEIRLIPGDENSVTTTYLNWGDGIASQGEEED